MPFLILLNIHIYKIHKDTTNIKINMISSSDKKSSVINMNRKILCVGRVCLDVVYTCTHFPLEDSTQRSVWCAYHHQLSCHSLSRDWNRFATYVRKNILIIYLFLFFLFVLKSGFAKLKGILKYTDSSFVCFTFIHNNKWNLLLFYIIMYYIYGIYIFKIMQNLCRNFL